MRRTDCDVVVLGLGGMGSSAAYQLARRGRRVVGIEQFGPAHDRGSSHGETRLVRLAYFEDPRYVPLLRRAYELWDELAVRTGERTLTRTGALMVGPADGEVVRGTLASVEQWGLAHELLDPAAVARRFPAFTLAPDELAVHEAEGGFVGPEATVAQHVRLAADAGATLLFHRAARGWRLTADGVAVELDVADGGGTGGTGGTEEVHAAHLVVSAGAWSARVLADLGLGHVLAPERQVMHWFAPRAHPGRFALGTLPTYLWECSDGLELYGFPATGGAADGVKVAFYRAGRPTDPDRLDTAVAAADADRLRRELAGRVPDLAGTWLRGQACMYTMTPDHHFVLGPAPGTDGRVSIAAGFSGHGFKFVPVVGEVLADLATGGTSPLDLSLFDPTRFLPVTG